MLMLLLAGPIPGVPFSYIPNQGALQAFELQERMMVVALSLAGLFFLFGAFLVLKSQWDAPQPWWALGKNFVLVAVLLSCYSFVFSVPLDVSRIAARALFSNTDLSALNAEIREAAEKEQSGPGDTTQTTWYGRLFALVGALNFTAIGTTNGVLTLTTIAFYASVAGMTFLWKFAVVALFAVGPLMIVAGLIGGWGEAILGYWLTALIQVSLWQVWFAICTFFVRTSDSFVLPGDMAASSPNHYESIGLCILFTIAHLGTPKIVNALVPISRFSAAISGQVSAGMSAVTGTPMRLLTLNKMGFTRSKK